RMGGELSEPRFVMLETLREYGLARLADAKEDGYTRKAHAAYCIVLAEEWQTGTDQDHASFSARFAQEMGNFWAAWEWLTASGEAQWGMRLATAMSRYCEEAGLANASYELIHKLLNLPAAAPRNRTRGWALASAADLAWQSGRQPEGERLYKESLELLE